MSTSRAELLRAIVACPDDVELRLVYADQLLSAGDQRGLFIQVQCEIEATPEHSPRYRELTSLERELLLEHGRAWAHPIQAHDLDDLTFVRGFVEAWRCTGPEFIQRGRRVCEVTPLRKLEVRWAELRHVRHLVKIDAFHRFERLGFLDFVEWPCEQIGNWGRFARLEGLQLRARRRIGRGPQFGAGLRSDRSFAPLTQTTWFGRLCRLVRLRRRRVSKSTSSWGFNRVGTIAWWLNGKFLKRRTFGLAQVKVLNALTPIFRKIDDQLPLPELSVIAVLRPSRSGPQAARKSGAQPEPVRATQAGAPARS